MILFEVEARFAGDVWRNVGIAAYETDDWELALIEWRKEHLKLYGKFPEAWLELRASRQGVA